MSRSEFNKHPVMGLIRRLTTFWVDWSHVSQRNAPRDVIDYEPGIDRMEQDVERANVVSSLRKIENPDFLTDVSGTHALLLDLDVPAYLVPSSTPGHSHLYVDVQIPHMRYMALLAALADAGVIERGYAEVSIKRGHSDLRLPGVMKGEPTPPRPVLPTIPVLTVPDF